jgi:SAM-dependent methyltransferase
MSSIHDDWDRHWEEYAESAEANPAQDYRRTVILSLLALPALGKGVRLLDIGSGQGDMAAAIRARFPQAEILGLELSQSGVELSQRKVPGARFVQRNLLEPGSTPDDQRAWATHAVCSEVIEHVDDPRRLLGRARDYMAPGCRLVVTAPGGPMSAYDRHIGHRKHFRRAEIAALLRQAGYEAEQVTGAGFPFFNLYRGVVILRGKKLIEDVRIKQDRPASLPARLAMGVFSLLFHLSVDSSRWGWQMVAQARAGTAPP